MEEDNIIKMSKAGYLYMFMTSRLRRRDVISIYRISHADSCVDMWAISNICSFTVRHVLACEAWHVSYNR